MTDNHGANLLGCERYDEALECHHAAEQLFLQLFGPDHFPLSITYNSIGNCYLAKGERARARDYVIKAKDLIFLKLGKDSYYYANCLLSESRTYLVNDRVPEKDKHYYREILNEAILIFKNLYKNDHADISKALHQLALSYFDSSEIEQAILFLQDALAMMIRFTSDQDRQTIPSRFMLACAYEENGQHELALEQFKICKALFIQYPDNVKKYQQLTQQHIEKLSSADKMPFFKSKTDHSDDEKKSNDKSSVVELSESNLEF